MTWVSFRELPRSHTLAAAVATEELSTAVAVILGFCLMFSVCIQCASTVHSGVHLYPTRIVYDRIRSLHIRAEDSTV